MFKSMKNKSSAVVLGAVAFACCLYALAQVGSGTAGTFDPLLQAAAPSRLAQRSVLVAAARAGDRVVAVGERGHALLSDDSGASWRQAAVPVSVTLTAVRFVDAQQGWAVGHSGVVLHTRDGGEHWETQLDGRQMVKRLVDAAPSADAATQERIARLQQDGPDKPLLNLLFSDAQNGLVVGAYGLAFETRDGGKQWRPLLAELPNPDERHLYVAHERADGLYLAGEQGLMWRRAPGQGTFEPLKTPFQSTVFDLATSADGTLLAFGLGGKLYRSTDQGRSWTGSEPAGKAALTAGVVVPGGLVLAGEAGQQLFTSDGGTTFETLVGQGFPIAALVAAPKQLVAVGPLGLQVFPTPSDKKN